MRFRFFYRDLIAAGLINIISCIILTAIDILLRVVASCMVSKVVVMRIRMVQ